jgi:hypothetical protein
MTVPEETVLAAAFSSGFVAVILLGCGAVAWRHWDTLRRYSSTLWTCVRGRQRVSFDAEDLEEQIE